MASFNISVRTGGSLHPDGEPSDFVSPCGSIVTCTDVAEAQSRPAGRLAHHAPAARLLRVPKGWLPRHETRADRKAATVRLRGYFRHMGFERLGRSADYALPLNLIVPGATELLGGGPEEKEEEVAPAG